MAIHITPSHPDRMAETWKEDDILFKRFRNHWTDTSYNFNNKTVYDCLRDYDVIAWDWTGVRQERINIGDKIFIYFSKISMISCLTEVIDVDYFPILDRPLVAVLKKNNWFDLNTSEQLSFQNLRNNGLTSQLQNLATVTENNNLLKYIKEVTHVDF